MGAMTKVHKDRYGLFVRTGGYIFRPFKTAHSYPLARAANSIDCGATKFVAGDAVDCRHMAQTPFARVRDHGRGIYETWHSHGDYMTAAGGIGPSEKCWRPA
jgi:hypothetical protein